MSLARALRLWFEQLSLQRVIQVQSAYYLVTAFWPVLHFSSFRWVVGPKPDRFQFWTTNWLIMAIGAALGIGARRRPDAGTAALGVISTAAFIGVEAYHIRRIRKVFLADMLAEALIGAAIVFRLLRPAPGNHHADADE
jgi:FtsH-binding integral membrane protein